jgi:cullin 3
MNVILIYQRVLTDNSFEESWSVLSKAFTEIHNKNISELSYEVLYRNAYTLVLHKEGKRLYQAAKEVVEAHLETVAAGDVHSAWQELVSAPGTRDYQKQDAGVRFLKVVRDAWEEHTLCMKMIRDVLSYLVSSFNVCITNSRIELT